jgi:thioredoxin reductase (NADPH)
VKDPEKYRGKKVVIAGGGDSALDWTIFLADIADEVTLVHRNNGFRGAPDSAQKVLDLAEAGRIKLLLNTNLNGVYGHNVLREVGVLNKEKEELRIPADHLIPLFGLSPKLGPLENWGLEIQDNALVVNTRDFETNIPGIYAIGDINTYPGKLKLILCGFHEAALMSHGAFRYIYPEKVLNLKYTTVNGVQGF